MGADSNLLRQIDTKKRKIEEDPSYYLIRDKRVKRRLTSVLRLHSWWLEHPKIRNILLSGNELTREEAIKYAQQGVANLNNAWDYIHLEEDPLSVDAMRTAASLIEPTLNEYGKYRTATARLLGMRHVPPNYMKIPALIESLFVELKHSGLHPVERAALVHLGIAYIQPFADGNKRTARLMQDKVLYDYGLPSAVIPMGEREVYLDLLGQAFEGRSTDSLKLQIPFFDYVGGKVNTALDDILRDLNIKPKS